MSQRLASPCMNSLAPRRSGGTRPGHAGGSSDLSKITFVARQARSWTHEHGGNNKRTHTEGRDVESLDACSAIEAETIGCWLLVHVLHNFGPTGIFERPPSRKGDFRICYMLCALVLCLHLGPNGVPFLMVACVDIVWLSAVWCSIVLLPMSQV